MLVFRFDLDNKLDGFYISLPFMDKLVVHITKNFLKLPNIKVPPKSFQCELVFKKMGIKFTWETSSQIYNFIMLYIQIILHVEILHLEIPENDRRSGGQLRAEVVRHKSQADAVSSDNGEVVCQWQLHFCASLEMKLQIRHVYCAVAGDIEARAQPGNALQFSGTRVGFHLTEERVLDEFEYVVGQECEGGAGIHDCAAVPLRIRREVLVWDLQFLVSHGDFPQGSAAATKPSDSGGLLGGKDGTTHHKTRDFLLRKIQGINQSKAAGGARAVENQIRRADLIASFSGERRPAILAAILHTGAVNPTAFRVGAAENLSRGRRFGHERSNRSCAFETAVSALVPFCAREPNKAASGIHNKRQGLRGSSEAE
nr:ribulose bisphosphate carboxylase/oxygenase activase 1, chloroplastic isoform X2 [Ipomoea batatas]